MVEIIIDPQHHKTIQNDWTPSEEIDSLVQTYLIATSTCNWVGPQVLSTLVTALPIQNKHKKNTNSHDQSNMNEINNMLYFQFSKTRERDKEREREKGAIEERLLS